MKGDPEILIDDSPLQQGQFDLILRLDKDLREAARSLGRSQVRYLVDTYYQMQRYRIASAAQIRANQENTEPNRMLDWMFSQMAALEGDIKRALDTFTNEYRVGLWLKSITGIGPVISAGLIAHLTDSLEDSVVAGRFWSFAGLDPTKVWKKGEKRPWNAKLKSLLAFKAGESFVKFQNNKNDHYGRYYKARKEVEIARNEKLQFKEQAEEVLKTKRIGKDTEAYKWYSIGKLPPAHIHARARRVAVKLFVSHLHHVMYLDWHGKEPPKPYVFSKAVPPHDPGHYIPPPNLPLPTEGKSLREMGE